MIVHGGTDNKDCTIIASVRGGGGLIKETADEAGWYTVGGDDSVATMEKVIV